MKEILEKLGKSLIALSALETRTEDVSQHVLRVEKKVDGLVERICKVEIEETRTEDVSQHVLRVEKKVDNLVERICKVETEFKYLPEKIKKDTVDEIKQELASLQYYIQNPRALKTHSNDGQISIKKENKE